jgi:hypothetical protein
MVRDLQKATLRQADHSSEESCCMVYEPHNEEALAQFWAVAPLDGWMSIQ